MAADPNEVSQLSVNPVVDEAMKRFRRCAEWEATARERFLDDLKFAEGDSENGYQWPNAIQRSRDVADRPCLTINVIKQHNLQIVNAGKKNKSDVKVVGMGNGATQESALAIKAIMRHVKYQSNAQSAYSTAREYQVTAGLGWWRIVTDYTGPDSFDQEIFIRRVFDPLSIYMDPDIKEKDGSDARFCFVFDLLPKDQFNELYPEYRDKVTWAPLGVDSGDGDWLAKDHVRVCEYWRKVRVKDEVLSFIVGGSAAGRATGRKSLLPKNVYQDLKARETTLSRETWDDVVEWYLIIGEEIADETVWPGKYLPFVRCLGTETINEGVLDRKGHTRTMKDAQRIFNYNASAQVEFGALQVKTPWTAAAQSIEGYETYWNSANTTNHSVLPFKHIDNDGNPLPPQALPQRIEPPTASPSFQAGMDSAFNWMMMASGQWQNQMGMMGNERTGSAIAERQEQSETSTYHFQDNFEEALRFEGKILIDLIPKVYDTKRMLMCQADDGTDMEMLLDPGAQQAYRQELDNNNKVVKRLLNPSLGIYNVAADVGPDWTTRRQETANALTTIITQAPALTGIIGDLLVACLDFNEAQEAAQRLKRMVPAQALGQGPTQAEQALQAQLTQVQAALAKALERTGKDSVKLVDKAEIAKTDAFRAFTDRIKVMLDHNVDRATLEQQLRQMTLDFATDMKQMETEQVTAAGGDEGAGGSPQGSATETPAPPPAIPQSPGEWFLSDPTRHLRALRVGPLAQERQERGVVGNG